MKNFGCLFLMTFLFIIGCKDVEKNPSGCGFQYQMDSNGNCVSEKSIFEALRNSHEKLIYQNSFYLKYITSNQSGQYLWNYALIMNSMNDKAKIEEMLSLIDAKKELIPIVKSYRDKCYDLYYNQDLYADGVYNAYNKADSLHNFLVSSDMFDTTRMFTNSHNLEDISAIDRQQITENQLKFEKGIRDKYKVDLCVAKTPSNSWGNIQVTVPLRGEQDNRNIYDTLVQAISDDCNAEEACIQDTHREIKISARDLYPKVYISIIQYL